MLEILQTKNFEKYIDKLDKMKILDKFPNVVEATDKDEILGLGIYHFDDDAVVLDEIEANGDLYLYDGIVRSILFLAMMKEIDVAKFNLCDMTNVTKLGFVKDDEKTLSPITGFMSKCKSCGK